VLLSGDHAGIGRWRLERALERTWRRRPDLLARARLAPEAQSALNEVLAAQAVAQENRGT